MSRAVAIVVLGMHRSGTSALAGCLQLLGIPLGSPLMPANFDNEHGFFEQTEIASIHDNLLAGFGTSALDLDALPPDWNRTAAAEAARTALLTVVRRNFAESPLWAVKDPRLCILFPLWRPLLAELDIEPRFAFSFRNPWDVAKSLETRNGLEASESLDLWIRYSAAAERESREYPRALTAFDDLLADPVLALTALASRLEIQWPRPLDDHASAELRHFLEPSLRHWTTAAPPDTVGAPLVQSIEAFEPLFKAVISGHEQPCRLEAVESATTSLLAPMRAARAMIDSSEDEYAVRWSSAEVPAELRVGTRLFAPCALRHEGVKSISKRALSISYHWVAAQDPTHVVVWDGLRTPVRSVIRPGGTYEARVSIQAPEVPGFYLLILDVVREGVVWFSQTGLQSPRIPVTVRAG